MTTPTNSHESQNPIIALPSMMQKTPTGDQAPLPIAPTITITEGPEFDPTVFLDPDQVKQIQAYARDFVRSPDCDLALCMKLIENFHAGENPDIDAMLDTLRMLNYGDMAKTLQGYTGQMAKVGKRIPVIDPKWYERAEQGKTFFHDMADNVQWLVNEIKEALDLLHSFKDEFDQADRTLKGHQDKMSEYRVRNDAIAKQEYARALRLLQLCATLKFIWIEIGVRVNEIMTELAKAPNPKLSEEQRRLENLSPIMINTIGSLVPFYPITTNNGIMFTQQRNDNALQEFRLYLFRTFGIAQWKATTLIQLNAVANRAARLAEAIAKKAMNEDSLRASGAFKTEMDQMAQDLQDFMVEMDTFKTQTQAIVDANAILTEGLKAADEKVHETARVVEGGRREVESSQKKWSAALASITTGNPA